MKFEKHVQDTTVDPNHTASTAVQVSIISYQDLCNSFLTLVRPGDLLLWNLFSTQQPE